MGCNDTSSIYIFVSTIGYHRIRTYAPAPFFIIALNWRPKKNNFVWRIPIANFFWRYMIVKIIFQSIFICQIKNQISGRNDCAQKETKGCFHDLHYTGLGQQHHRWQTLTQQLFELLNHNHSILSIDMDYFLHSMLKSTKYIAKQKFVFKYVSADY